MIAAVNAKEWQLISTGRMDRKVICALISVCVFAFANLQGAYKCAFILSLYGDGSFWSVLMTWLGGVSATILILYLMQVLEHYWTSPTLSFIGKNTMTLYLWNMIFNTIFSILLLKITGSEMALDSHDMSLFAPDSYVFIALTAALTVTTGTLMARYKKSHEGSLLAKII